MFAEREGSNVWVWGVSQRQAGSCKCRIIGRNGWPRDGDYVILLGGAPLPEQVRRTRLHVVNNGAPAFYANGWKAYADRLVRAGVPICGAQEEDGRRRRGWKNRRLLMVRLFQHLPLRVEEHAEHSFHAVGTNSLSGWRELGSGHSLYRKAVSTAARALYALGLDCGAVQLEIGDRESCKIMEIQLPGDELAAGEGQREGKAAPLWLQSVLNYRNAVLSLSNGREQIMIGADPEFLLVSKQGKVVPASRYLQDGHGIGCDAVYMQGRIHYPIAELRPDPAHTPEGVMRHIRSLLAQADRQVKDKTVKWLAGGMPVKGFALGGHIHLSGVPVHGKLLRMLDSYIAFPLALIESEDARRRRPRYGVLGDFRMQAHGGFEYRTPPSWLVSPLAAKAALALALVCARHAGELSYCPAEEEKYVAAYYSGRHEALRECLNPLLAQLQELEEWPRYASSIEPLFTAAAQGLSWNEKQDIRDKWKIPENGRIAAAQP